MCVKYILSSKIDVDQVLFIGDPSGEGGGMVDKFLFMVILALKIAHKLFFTPYKIQTVSYLFNVHFNAETLRYHFGERFF